MGLKIFDVKENKGYGMYVYFDLFHRGFQEFLDVLILSYMIHLKKFSPTFQPDFKYLMDFFGVDGNALTFSLYRLLDRKVLIQDKKGEIKLDMVKTTEVLGFDVFGMTKKVEVINQ